MEITFDIPLRPDSNLSIPGSELHERFKNSLQYLGYKNFIQLAGMSDKQLLRLKGIGLLAVHQINQALEKRGLKPKA